MNTRIYELLNRDAKDWWYHQELRKRGNHVEARKRERRSIKSSIKGIKNALSTPGAYAHIGYGGKSLYTRNSTLSGIHNGHWEAIIAAGIPTIDVRPVVDNGKWTIKTPMIAVGHDPDPAPYNSLSYAPRDYVFADYVKRGAIVHNWPTDLD